MPEIIFSNYFCGDEPEEFICFKISQQLTVSLKFRHVSAAARPPHGTPPERTSLSAESGRQRSLKRRFHVRGDCGAGTARKASLDGFRQICPEPETAADKPQPTALTLAERAGQAA